MSVIDDPTTIFGRIVTGYDVEQWVLALARKWFGTYLAEAERQHDYAACTFPRPRAWIVAPSFDKWPEDQLPAALVVSNGIVAPPRRDGAGVYRAQWRVEVGVCVSASTEAKSRELAELYLAALNAVIVQHPSLEGNAMGASWLELTYTPLDYDSTRSLYAGSSVFAVEVDDVVTTGAGPAEPDPAMDECAPWAPWPLVETVDVDVDNYTVDQPLPEEVRP
jgi:hypothetical protein